MKTEAIMEVLKRNPQVSDYKINVRKKESFELFYVKGRLETVRCTDTCDRIVTVYADHDGFRGDGEFSVYPSTTEQELQEKVSEAVRNALLIRNAPYTLPHGEQAEETLPSNLREEALPLLGDRIAKQVFAANTQKGGSLNAVEIFLNKYTDSVCSSRGLQKTQHRCTAMVEAIPTFNGDRESVELYEQYNFSAYDEEALLREISEKMAAVKARYEAVTPDFPMDCPVIFHKQELVDLFSAIAGDLNYGTVYSHGNLFSRGDRIQQSPAGDALTITMKGSVPGNVASSAFDGDGLSLGEITLVEAGQALNYYGSSRFGQYLGEQPTGNLGCLCVSPGSFSGVPQGAYLDVISMSGLQVDFFGDYIGGEIRLAYYHDGEKTVPVTGISVSGKLREVLDHLKLSQQISTFDSYTGPSAVMAEKLKIF